MADTPHYRASPIFEQISSDICEIYLCVLDIRQIFYQSDEPDQPDFPTGAQKLFFPMFCGSLLLAALATPRLCRWAPDSPSPAEPTIDLIARKEEALATA